MRVPHLIDQKADSPRLLILTDHLDDGVGIGDRRRLRCRDDQHIIGGAREGEDVGADAGAGVDEDDIHRLFQLAERIDQALAIEFRQVRHSREARGAADEPEASRRLVHDIAQIFLARDDVR